MTLTTEATYENGTLKLAAPLPLKEHQRVQITVQLPADIEAALAAVQRGYGLLGWTGDPKIVEHVALAPDLGIRGVAMTFADIPAAASVFVDANVFVFYSVPHATLGPSCRQLMERIARQEITGYTSADALSDVAHRFMTFEAAAFFNKSLTGISAHLKKHPSDIQHLSHFRQAIEEIVQIGVRVLPTEVPLVLAAARLSQQHGLLSGDALIVAVMQQHGLTNLASHDGDFDRVPG